MLTRPCVALLVLSAVLPFTRPLASSDHDDLRATAAPHLEPRSAPTPMGVTVTETLVTSALATVPVPTSGRDLLPDGPAALSMGAVRERRATATAPVHTGPEVPSLATTFVLRI